MASYVIEGGYSLDGSIRPQGAKNEALQIVSSVLLTPEEVTIHNIPNILDVNNLIDLLRQVGVKVTKLNEEGSYTFQADEVNIDYLHSEEFLSRSRALRGSILMAGALLGRFGYALFPKPGGDKIGRRRLDTHLIGFQELGASCDYDTEKQSYILRGETLRGKYMLLDEASVTGTANILMAAVLAESNRLTIEGVKSLHGAEHTMLPDMIEIGSFIGMAAMTNSQLRIKDVSIPDLGIIPQAFRRLGITIEEQGDDLFIPRHPNGYEIDTFMDGSILTVADAPWPGLTPDLLSVFLVTATQAKGSVLIHQKMFESRLFFVDKLIDMGAQIMLCDPHRAVVIGLGGRHKLRPATMVSPDIRAGIALLIAAMSADGTSVINNVEQIDRGYQDIAGRLNALGARISRL